MGSAINLLVRADDAGSSWSSNMGCLRACTDGIARSVEVMMPCGWVSHAARLFGDRPDIDIGIHLTLTSEWEAVRWRPLTQAPSLVDDDGFFLPLLMPRDSDTRPCLAHADWRLDDIACELRAQIMLGKKLFAHASHVSAHMIRHFKELDPRIGEIVAALCDEFGVKDDAFGHGLERIAGYPPFPRDATQRTAAFIDQLSTLQGGTYIFIDHPAVGSPELSATGHAGYEDVSADRTSCLETLTSDALMAHIKALDIKLISYRDL